MQPQFPKSTPEPNNPNGYMFRQLHTTNNRIDSLKSAHIDWQQSLGFANSVNKSLFFMHNSQNKQERNKKQIHTLLKLVLVQFRTA